MDAHLATNEALRHCRFESCQRVSIEIAVWLLFIADNTLHLLINLYAVIYL